MRNNERGITLVALVVTIVVLLILAGITITYVLSDNGIFGKANDAATKMDKASVTEAVSLALANLQAEVYAPTTGKTPAEVFAADFPSDMTATATTVTVSAEDGVTITGGKVTYKGYEYTVTYSKTAGLEVSDGTKVPA